MSKSLKINTALIICTAFVFRLLFINIGFISSFNSSQNNSIIKAQLATKMKRKKQVDAPDTKSNFYYSVAEICEEDSDENSEIKANQSFPFQTLCFLFVSSLADKLQKIIPSSGLVSFIPSHRYLAFQIIRI